jgi:phenylpyruvate tautomerase PptA (4-oxalocrotonate tautomerase family)
MRKLEFESSRASDVANSLSRRDFIILVGMTGIATVLPTKLLASTAQQSLPESHSISTENDNMPLVRIDTYEGRSEGEIKTLLDSAHRAIVKAFHLNERDRYQIYNARPRSHFIMQDTGLSIQRTDKALIITVMSKARPEVLKRRLYQEMTQELSRSAGIPPSDVMICIMENSSADWTFGNGEAQFLTGDLG